ncbi:MAG: glycyl-radical enzyme activating protein [Theionarchaea archaeon]|nr:glycyl-radical enzyme activating protein [Theionarchaea archaeon]
MTMGLIFDIKRYAVHDGPGIRTTVFLKGCPLTCLWCHNPEGISKESELMWSKERCIHCKTCQNACLQGALTFSDDALHINKNTCNLCTTCVDVCPSQALEVIGKEMTVTQVIKEIEKDTIFYDESKGGVTFSGGEPLMQPDFLYQLLKACKEQGIHTAVDTSGYSSSDALLKIGAYTDLFLYDVKVINDRIHKETTGVSNNLILKNLKELLRAGKEIIVRFPLIPGVNDGEKDIGELGEFVSSVTVKKVNILPYHKAGIEKAKRLNQNPFMCEPPSHTRVTSIKKRLEECGLNVTVGG